MNEQEGSTLDIEAETSEWDDFVAQVHGEIEHWWFSPAAALMADHRRPAVGATPPSRLPHRAASGRRQALPLSRILRQKLLPR
jgi:hypothetical protein